EHASFRQVGGSVEPAKRETTIDTSVFAKTNRHGVRPADSVPELHPFRLRRYPDCKSAVGIGVAGLGLALVDALLGGGSNEKMLGNTDGCRGPAPGSDARAGRSGRRTASRRAVSRPPRRSTGDA